MRNNLLFPLLAVAVAALAIAYLRRAPRRTPDWHVPTLPVNRRNLLWHGCLRRLRLWFAYTPFAFLIAGACWFSGQMSIGTALVTVAVLLFVPLIYVFQVLRVEYPPLRRTLAEADFDRELAGKEFRFLKNAWQYIDEDWFIRVGDNYAAALCARWIDFEKPARFRMREHVISSGRGANYIYAPLLRFTARDGSEIVARLNCSPDMIQWVEDHGGRILNQM